jgi:hypothetical protein
VQECEEIENQGEVLDEKSKKNGKKKKKTVTSDVPVQECEEIENQGEVLDEKSKKNGKKKKSSDLNSKESSNLPESEESDEVRSTVKRFLCKLSLTRGQLDLGGRAYNPDILSNIESLVYDYDAKDVRVLELYDAVQKAIRNVTSTSRSSSSEPSNSSGDSISQSSKSGRSKVPVTPVRTEQGFRATE